MALGDRTGGGQPPSTFGVQPSGPKLNVPRLDELTTPGRAPNIVSAHIGANSATGVGLGKVLPSSSTLDYAHKLTSTTVLVVAAIAFLLFGPRSAKGKVRALARKHVGGS